jgi:hypothetical protein
MDAILLEIVNTYGMELLKAIVLLIAGTLGLIACKLANRCLNTETKRTLARTGVLFVEQVYKDLHGEQKMAKFLEYAAAQLKRYGIKFDAEEMKALAEAFLAEFNEAFTKPLPILEGIAVEDLDDEQLRAFMRLNGFAYTEGMKREEMLAALDELDAAAAQS